VKVLIDSGSDINCIHPEFARVNNIKLMKAENPFKVASLGYGLSTAIKMGVGHFAKLHFARLHFANFFESMWRIKKMWHFAKLHFPKLHFPKLKIIK